MMHRFRMKRLIKMYRFLVQTTRPDAAEDVLDRSSSQRWGSSKLEEQPKTTAEQLAADQIPLRKARVSVRARSEAPMVISIHLILYTLYHLILHTQFELVN